MYIAANPSNALQWHIWYLVKDFVGLSLLENLVLDKRKADCVTWMKTENLTNDHLF